MTERELAALFDHTYLNADGTKADFDRIIEEAILIRPATVAVNQVPAIYFKEKLKAYGIKVCAGSGFPLGCNSIDVKVYEALDDIKNGVDEIDYVCNISKVKDHEWEYLDEEMRRMVEAIHGNKRLCKVILETCYLSDEEIVRMCELAVKHRVEFVKTSTGMVKGGGATVHAVELMKKTVGDVVGVKAAGGIRTWKDCKAMLKAGATRIGCSASLQILEEFRKEEGI
ncbi:MAG: deoxyribose-phosphate aldolase [Erysipelotrichaceae bacterium]|nr:deoxyribose-phosphate aldolase [Erysipelotrichaceae bacterium]